MRNILWRSQTAHRGHFDDGVLHVLDEVVGQIGGDKAGGDGIDGDATLTDFFGQALGQTDHARFRGGIVALSGVAGDAGHAGDIDDPAAALSHHDSCSRSGAVPGALEIGVDHQVPIRFFHHHNDVIARRAGIVHQDVQPPEFFLDIANQGAGLIEIADIGLSGNGLTACRHDFGDDLLAAASALLW